MSETQPSKRPEAKVRRSRISWIWLIPLIAAGVAAFLGYRTIREEGSVVTLAFNSADGLVAGQTTVRHKAVVLGQVETIRLAEDMSHVVVTIRMRREADPYLTDQARFWVVRPRITAGNLSGLETLVSGSYIEMDPGERNGAKDYQFVGLETPPAVRTGEPGRTYRLQAQRIGSLGPGAPVFYRDIQVGEVLDYDIGNGLGPVTLSVFVRRPYDRFVREGSHFWNASGLSVEIANGGIHVQLASIQAVLAGGVAFDAPQDGSAAPAPANAAFKLYQNYNDAKAAGYKTRQEFVTYFESSVSGLSPGAAVEFYGIQVGTVKAVDLDLDPDKATVRARVRFEIQPERIEPTEKVQQEDPVAVATRLVQHGMRVSLATASYLTGSQVLSLNFDPDAPKAELTKVGDDWVVPSEGGGLDTILSTVGNISAKLDRLPLDQIGQNLNTTLRSASGAMTSLQELATRANSGLSPALARLPAIIASVQDAVIRANHVFGSLDTGYGYNSQFQRDIDRALMEVGDTARSIRQLADFLDRHPEALIRGRVGYSSSQ